MAEESENGQEKTEEPTEKKLNDAKKKGQVPRSKELNSMTIMLIGSASLMLLGSHIIGSISTMMESGLTISRAEIFDTKSLIMRLNTSVIDSITGISPFLFLMTVVAIFTPMALGGWAFSAGALAFKGDRISPLSGFKRIFGPQGLMELVKALLKLVFVSGVAIIFLWTKRSLALGPSVIVLFLAL